MEQQLKTMANGHAAAPVGAVTIALPTDAELPPDLAADFAKSPPINAIRMLTLTDDMFAGLKGVISAVFKARGVESKLREIIILRAAHVLNVPYEWQVGSILGKNAGVTDAERDALGQDGPVQGLDAEATLLCQATDEMLQQATLTDATLAALLARYGTGLAAKYIVSIAWFNAISLIENALRVPLETDLARLQGQTSPV